MVTLILGIIAAAEWAAVVLLLRHGGDDAVLHYEDGYHDGLDAALDLRDE